MRAAVKCLLLTLLVATFGLVSAPDAFALPPIDEASFLTVTEPLDFGGTILPPGRYVISVLPVITNRNILQVTNEDRSKVLATILSIPHAIPAGTEQVNTQFVYFPAIEGSPRALRTWYAADSSGHYGHDIVYPERRAMELAAAAKEPVLAYKGEVAAVELKTAELEMVTPKMEVVPYVAPAPAPKPVLVAEARELPSTASRVPLVALIGLLMLGAALVVRAFRVA